MKGLLFLPWKVKAIAESSPTFEWQTRRLSGLKEINQEPASWSLGGWDNGYKAFVFYREIIVGDIERRHIKPHYQVGDIVYIKEAVWIDQSGGLWGYKGEIEWPPSNCGGKGYSPMFMPAWAARRFIKITGVGYERLQEITFENCLAEGIVSTEQWLEMSKGDNYKPPEPLHPEDLSNEEADREIDRGWREYTKQAYAMLWDSINPKHPWSSNPWIAVYSFVKQEKPNA